MSSRRLIVLGSASQVPTRHRSHNGYFLWFDDLGILFDPGEGTQRQMTLARVRSSQVHHICITHFHGDHCLGLAGLIQRISLDGVTHAIQVHFPASGGVYWERLRSSSIFLDRADLLARPIGEEGVVWATAELTLTTAPLEHTVPTWGFRFQEADARRMLPSQLDRHGIRGPDVGRLQREGRLNAGGRLVELEEVSEIRRGQSMAFVMDTRYCAAAVRLAQNVDLLVCESTYLDTERREAEVRGHMTAAQAGALAQEAGARVLVLTHFSQMYTQIERFALEAQLAFRGTVVVAKDLDVCDFPVRAAP